MQSQTKTINNASGFTLVELVVVIVLLGILAVTALPRFINLGQEARVALVKSMEGALRSVASNWYALCVVKTPCDSTSGFFYLSFNGKTYLLQNGYPEAGDTLDTDQIDVLIERSGFTVTLPDNLTTLFTLDSAPTPADCSVSYQQSLALGQFPVITPRISGC